MAKFKFFGISEADAEIKSADAAINPLLTAANITTIPVNGKPVAATSDEVPLAAKINALAATHKAGSGDEQMNQILANNQILADQAKASETRAVTAEASVSTLTAEKVALEARVKVLEGSVSTLTASNSELTNLRAAAVAEAGRVITEANALNSEISRLCLSANCLTDLRNASNELLASTATADEKLSAADRVKPADKLKAYAGALNAAVGRTGVTLAALPAPGLTATAAAKTEKTGRARFSAAVALNK